jgi:DNA-directed RNA polymerase subunit F
MPREITNKTPVTIAEARELLIERSEADELSYLQRGALEHAHITAKVSAEIAKELTRILVSRYKIELDNAITLVNILPNNIDELRQLLSDTSKYPTEIIEDISELIKIIEEEKPIPEKFRTALEKDIPDEKDEPEDKAAEEEGKPDWFDDVDKEDEYLDERD